MTSSCARCSDRRGQGRPPYDERVRSIWLLVAALLIAAIAAAVWPRDEVPPDRDDDAPTADVSPSSTDTLTPPLARTLSDFLFTVTAPPRAVDLTPGPAAQVKRLDDRTVLLDDLYTLRGTGSMHDPYLISWELLSSARADIDPAKQRYELPGRLAPLQDAWVQISGYWAVPLLRAESNQITVMQSRWDGCCIGLPPTPYDSIEVTLTRPISVTGQHLFRFGTLKGRLHIEPFAAGEFLLGLYRVDEAVMESM